MSDKRALRLVNETEGERELRKLHFTLGFYAVMVALCLIITAGGTYTWGRMKADEEEEKTADTIAVTVPTGTSEVVKFNPVNLHYIEVISAACDEPIRERENPLFESVPLDDELKVYVIEKCADMGISPAVVFAMMYHESRYQADVIGDGGNSLGIMQVQPRWHGERMERLGCYDLLNPYECVTVALDYLAELLDRYDGDIMKALTAYNAGHYKGKITQYAKAVMSEAERICEANGQN